jgi:hypothetical protein
MCWSYKEVGRKQVIYRGGSRLCERSGGAGQQAGDPRARARTKRRKVEERDNVRPQKGRARVFWSSTTDLVYRKEIGGWQRMDVVGSEGSNEPRPNPLYILHTHQVYWPHHPIDNCSRLPALSCPILSDIVRVRSRRYHVITTLCGLVHRSNPSIAIGTRRRVWPIQAEVSCSLAHG